MIKQSNFHQEFGKSSCLNVVIVGFADSSNPGVGGTVWGDIEFEALKGGVRDEIQSTRKEEKGNAGTHRKDDTFTFENLVATITAFSHIHKLVDAGLMQNALDIPDDESGPGKKVETNLGAMISSYLAAMNIAVTPTSWNLTRETMRFERNRSMILIAIQSVSGSMW